MLRNNNGDFLGTGKQINRIVTRLINEGAEVLCTHRLEEKPSVVVLKRYRDGSFSVCTEIRDITDFYYWLPEEERWSNEKLRMYVKMAGAMKKRGKLEKASRFERLYLTHF